jgi:hypothetical protein
MSSDATAWHPVEPDTPADVYFVELRRIDNRLFALGYGHYGRDGGAMIWNSIDGRPWARAQSGSFRGRAVRDIIDSPSGAIAIGYNAPIDSDDTSGFVLWPVRPDGSFGPVRVVETPNASAIVGGAVWTGEEFLAWGHDRWNEGPTILWASSDAEAWRQRGEIVGTASADVGQIVTAVGRLIAVGHEGRQYPLSPRAWTSTDSGRTWAMASVSTTDAAIYTVGVEGSVLVAGGRESFGVNQRAVSWSSIDGTAWTQLPDDEALPAIPGFSALTTASLREWTCAAGTFHEETPSRGAIYCRQR